MANLRDIKRRIRSVKNTAQITKAMQLVAASKMKRAQEMATAGRPYALLLAHMLQAVVPSRPSDFAHPLFEEREIKTRGILLVTTDKGLCGGLNANLFREIAAMGTNTAFVVIGRKGLQFLSRTRRNVLASFSVSDQARFAEVRPAIEVLMDEYQKGTIDTVEVLFPAFVNTLSQEPTIRELVPLGHLDEVLTSFGKLGVHLADRPMAEDTREMAFEPDAASLLGDLLTQYVRREIHEAVLEAKASEHSARMVAMKSATDNANKLVDSLTLDYNKARQAAITQEILEIAAATQFN